MKKFQITKLLFVMYTITQNAQVLAVDTAKEKKIKQTQSLRALMLKLSQEKSHYMFEPEGYDAIRSFHHIDESGDCYGNSGYVFTTHMRFKLNNDNTVTLSVSRIEMFNDYIRDIYIPGDNMYLIEEALARKQKAVTYKIVEIDNQIKFELITPNGDPNNHCRNSRDSSCVNTIFSLNADYTSSKLTAKLNISLFNFWQSCIDVTFKANNLTLEEKF